MKKNAMVWAVAAVLALGGTMARGDAITGASSPFRVDTRCKEFVIEEVKSDFCEGAYGMKGGKKATFLSGIPAEVAFEVKGRGNEIPIERITVNGRDFEGAAFTFDVGTLPWNECGPLVVVAHGTVEGMEVASEPFRVNLDVARLPVAADWIWERPSGCYKRPDKEPLFLFPAIEESVDLGNKALGFAGAGGNMKLPLAFERVPTLTFTESFDVGKGEYARTAGGGGTIGRLKGGKFTAQAGGAFRNVWDAGDARWLETKDGVWVKVKMDDVGWTWYPFSPLIGLYVSGTFFGSGSMELGWNHLGERLFYEAEFDPLVGFKGAAGMGWRNLEGVGVYASGGVYAKLSTEEPFALAIDLKAGCEYSDLEIGEFGQELEFYRKRIPLLPTKMDPTEFYRSNPDPAIWKRLRAQMCMKPEEEPGLVCTPNGSAQVCLGTAGGGASAKGARVAGMPIFTVAVETAEGRTEETPWADGTPDSSPRLGADSDGRLFAAWMNARAAYGGEATADEVLGNQEIAVAVRNPGTGEWTARNLTDNAVLDAAPALAVGANGLAFAAWLQNDGNGFFSTPEMPSRLYAARWVDGEWRGPELVATLSGGAGSFDLASDGKRAVLIWSLDSDGDAATADDCELHASVWNGAAWGAEERLTANTVVDFAPKAFFKTNGMFAVVWNRDGEWVMGEEGAFEAATAIPMPEEVSVPGEISLTVAGEGRTAMLWGDGDEVQCMVFDHGSGEWTEPAVVAKSEKAILAFGAVFDAGGNTMLATEEASFEVGDDGRISVGESTVERTVFGHGPDPAVLAEDFAFAANEVVAGEMTPIVTTVRNLGLEGMTNVAVRFWVGDGELEEDVDARCELWNETGETCVVDLAGGETVVVTNLWMAEDFRTNLTFVAQIELPEGTEDRDTANNMAVWRPGTPELRLENARCDAVGAEVRLLTATVRNGGLAAAEAGTAVSFRLGSPDGEEIGRDVAGVVPAGADHGYDAGIAWDMSGGTWTGAWAMVYAVIDTGNAETDASTAVPIRVMTPLDRDGEGLLDGEEEAMGTDPLNPDTNGDGVGDWEHVYVFFTDPLAGMDGRWTTNTPVRVPFEWLERFGEELAAHGGDHEAFAADTAANGRPVWACYVADLDPTDAGAQLKMRWEDGEPVYGPKSAGRVYVLEGSEDLTNPAGWCNPTNSRQRFFRVRVQVPQP